ncbi:MAG: 50S ribosomal protein L3 [Candidatus Kapaibacteriales bacterium]
MQAAILGKKIGMTSYYTKTGEQVACTVVEAGPCPVVLNRTKENDGYQAVQIAYGEKPSRTTNKPDAGQFSKAGVDPHYHLREFDVNGEYNPGDNLTVDQFEIGDKVRVSGVSKGKGFQGVMKRYNFKGVGMATHGQSDRQRHPGSIGQSSDSSRVFKGLKMAGRMGGNRTSVRNLMVVDIIPENNLMLIKGSIPGAKSSLIEIIKL